MSFFKVCFLLWAMHSVHCMNNLVELMIQQDGLPDIKPRSFERLNLITPSIAPGSESGRVESVVSHQVRTLQFLI